MFGALIDSLPVVFAHNFYGTTVTSMVNRKNLADASAYQAQ
jgi:hypothetical protein